MYTFTEMFYFRPSQRPPLRGLTGEFWPAEGAIPIGPPGHSLEPSEQPLYLYLSKTDYAAIMVPGKIIRYNRQLYLEELRFVSVWNIL